jgi:hypothetical protein
MVVWIGFVFFRTGNIRYLCELGNENSVPIRQGQLVEQFSDCGFLGQILAV